MISSVGQGASVTIQVTIGQDRARSRIKGGQVEKGTNACENIVEGGSTRAEEREAARVLVQGDLEKPAWGRRGGDGVAVIMWRRGRMGVELRDRRRISLSRGSANERDTPGKRWTRAG